MAPRSKSQKSRKALERKEKKILEARIRASQERCEEGRVFLEPVGRNAQPNYTKAVAVLEAAIEAYDGNADAYFYLGECFRGQAEHDKAIEHYTQCLEKDHTNIRALEGRAASYMAKHNWPLAFEDYNTLIKIEPENDHAYNFRGLCTLSTRVPGLRQLSANFERCVADFQTAIRLNEANYYAWANLGRAYEDQGMMEQAVKAYSSALEVKDDYQYAQLRRGCLALRIVESSWEHNHNKSSSSKGLNQNNTDISGTSEGPKSLEEVEAMLHAELKAKERRKYEENLLNTAIEDFRALMTDDANQMKWDPCLPLNLGSCFILEGNFKKAEEALALVSNIIKARPQLVADGEAEAIPNVHALEMILNLKGEELKRLRDERIETEKYLTQEAGG